MVPLANPADRTAGFGGNLGVVWPEFVSLTKRGDTLGGWAEMLLTKIA